MSGTVVQLLFGVLLAVRKELGVDFLTRFDLGLPGWYEFLGGRLAKFICLWFVIRLRVALLKNGHVDAQCDRSKQKRQLSTLSAEDTMLE